jgi:hypothetical protein
MISVTNIDWKLLRVQKAALLDLALSGRVSETEMELLTGVLHLLDYIQDEAAANSEIGIKQVFGESPDQPIDALELQSIA